jgi:alkanesulfonate monooxygenase SsuD/methylene tetrahydromethanopterin reductase-like flavin-dependent oxidoreductase (luciferase family)
VEGWSKATPEVAKWTKTTVGQHITVGGLGATPVGTAAQVADSLERWVQEADVDGFNLVRLRSTQQLSTRGSSDISRNRRMLLSLGLSRISLNC